MKPSNVLLVALATGSVALAQTSAEVPAWDLGDPHLNVVPRTAEEAARIAAVTAIETDFTAPHRFEEKSAGAATVRAMTNADAFS